MTRTMRPTPAAIVAVAVLMLSACGSGGSAKPSASSSDTKPRATLGAQVCAAYLRATRAQDRPSVQAHRALAELVKIRPEAADRARLQAVVDAYRQVERVWSDTAPTTPTDFGRAATAASAAYGKAAEAAGVNPCPRPGAATTTTTGAADATKPTWAFNTVDRPTSGDGLWVYFDATCPSGTTVTGVTEPWVVNPGAPGVSFAALVAGLPAAAPFTATAADVAFAAKPAFTGACA